MSKPSGKQKNYVPYQFVNVKCVDCGAQAVEYDHRDYNRPRDVDAVCHSCNIQRGPGIPFRPTRYGKRAWELTWIPTYRYEIFEHFAEGHSIEAIAKWMRIGPCLVKRGIYLALGLSVSNGCVKRAARAIATKLVINVKTVESLRQRAKSEGRLVRKSSPYGSHS